MRNKLTFLLVVFYSAVAMAQVGGKHVYEFLNLSPSARVTGLGDYLVSVYDDDANLALLNPAVLNAESSTHINFSQTFHFSDISNGYASYSHFLKKFDISVHGGVQYVNYGDFNLADEFGTISGQFTVGEQAMTLGASKSLNENYSVGSNMKFIFSNFESYSSAGFAFDIGGLYRQEEKMFSAGFVVRNLGAQFTAYNEEREPLPFDVMFGVSKQLAHLPLRFSVIAHHLHRWNITFDDPAMENNLLFPNNRTQAVDNFFRHFVFNGEFLLGKGGPLRLRFAYNHFRRRELSLTDFISLAGFSGGFGIKAKRWRVDYGFNIYHLHGSVHQLSFGTSLNAFRNRKEI